MNSTKDQMGLFRTHNFFSMTNRKHTQHEDTRKLVKIGPYELKQVLGRGNFATVRLANHSLTDTLVAVKIIQKKRSDYYKEKDIMAKLNHPHIVKLFEVLETDHHLYLVTEYASKGELFDHIVKNGRIGEKKACKIFTQILSAVHYCHQHKIVHRDLKAENLLFDENYNIKIADFGFSKFYQPNALCETWCGSPAYAAPEIFIGVAYDGPRSEIWSLGVVLYILVCGTLPFDAETISMLKERVLLGKYRIPYFMSSGEYSGGVENIVPLK